MTIRFHKQRLLLVVVLVALSELAYAEGPRLYKWIDDEGNVHYSDSIPPEEAKRRREREIKSESGQTVDRIMPPPTRDELDARERARRAEEETQRRRAEQTKRDRTLMLTFRSVEQMKQARDDRLTALDAQIGLIQSRIDKLTDLRAARRENAVRIERTGKGDLGEVYAAIAELERRIADNRDFIERKRREKSRIRQDFAADIERFRELKNQDRTKSPNES